MKILSSPTLALVLLLTLPQTSSAAERWHADEIKTSIAFNIALLNNLGVEVRDLRNQAQALDHHHLSVSAGSDLAFETLGPLGLAAEVDGHSFERLIGGALVHRGGFDLVSRQGRVSLHGFQLNAGAAPRTFELRSTQGELLFTAGFAHFAVEREKSRIRIFNMDLRLSAWLAERIFSPEFAGASVGVLALEARIVAPPPLPEATPVAGGPPPCNDFSGNVDVALINLSSVGQTERSGGIVTVTPSAVLKNVGTANVPWHDKFSGNQPPYNNDQHPYLVWTMYRVANGVIEQLGLSPVKHAFLTINDNCDPGACTDGNVLGLGCEDVYGEGTNIFDGVLSIRQELSAGTGLWTSTGSHFDQDSNGSQDHPPSNPDPSMFHRLQIRETDLQTAGAQYFMEGWYIIRDDINIFNNMGYRRITPVQGGGGNWTFTLNTGLAEGSAVNVWVDPSNPGAGNKNELFSTADGEVRLAVKTTSLGGGLYRYEYALMNHDFDRQIASFRIPIGLSVDVSNPRFRDVDSHVVNDWNFFVTETGVVWNKPDGSPGQDYGTLYNFGITANAPPAEVSIELVPIEAGFPAILSIPSLGPSNATSIIFQDGFETGTTGAWSLVTP